MGILHLIFILMSAAHQCDVEMSVPNSNGEIVFTRGKIVLEKAKSCYACASKTQCRSAVDAVIACKKSGASANCTQLVTTCTSACSAPSGNTCIEEDIEDLSRGRALCASGSPKEKLVSANEIKRIVDERFKELSSGKSEPTSSLSTASVFYASSSNEESGGLKEEPEITGVRPVAYAASSGVDSSPGTASASPIEAGGDSRGGNGESSLATLGDGVRVDTPAASRMKSTWVDEWMSDTKTGSDSPSEDQWYEAPAPRQFAKTPPRALESAAKIASPTPHARVFSAPGVPPQRQDDKQSLAQVARLTVESPHFTGAFHGRVPTPKTATKPLSARSLERLHRITARKNVDGGRMDLERLLEGVRRKLRAPAQAAPQLPRDIDRGHHSVFQNMSSFYNSKIRIDHHGEIAN